MSSSRAIETFWRARRSFRGVRTIGDTVMQMFAQAASHWEWLLLWLCTLQKLLIRKPWLDAHSYHSNQEITCKCVFILWNGAALVRVPGLRSVMWSPEHMWQGPLIVRTHFKMQEQLKTCQTRFNWLNVRLKLKKIIKLKFIFTILLGMYVKVFYVENQTI